MLYLEPQEGWSEQQLEAFYKQGFCLEDSRDMKELSSAYTDSPMERSLAGVREPGVQTVTDLEGNQVEALWGPMLPSGDCPSACGSAGQVLKDDYALVLLDGADKGAVVCYHAYGTRAADLPVFCDEANEELLPDKEAGFVERTHPDAQRPGEGNRAYNARRLGITPEQADILNNASAAQHDALMARFRAQGGNSPAAPPTMGPPAPPSILPPGTANIPMQPVQGGPADVPKPAEMAVPPPQRQNLSSLLYQKTRDYMFPRPNPNPQSILRPSSVPPLNPKAPSFLRPSPIPPINPKAPSFLQAPSKKASAEDYGETPKAGNAYAVWLPSLQKFLSVPFVVKTVEKRDGLTRINFGAGSCNQAEKLVINPEIETAEEDLQAHGTMPKVVGSDAVFIPVRAEFEYSDQPSTAKSISWARVTPPATFTPLTVGRMDEALLKTKTAKVTLVPVGHGRADLMFNGRRKLEDAGLMELSAKLARDLRLPAAEAIDLARKGVAEKTEFHVVSPYWRMKLARAYYGKEANWGDARRAAGDYMKDLWGGVKQTLLVPAGKSFTEPNHIFREPVGIPGSEPRTQQPTSTTQGPPETPAMDTLPQPGEQNRKAAASDNQDLEIIEAGGEKAAAYYDRDIDPDAEFENYDYDSDLNVLIDYNQHRAIALAMREQQVSPQRNYLDAKGYGGPRNKPHTHIPDEVILGMEDPLRQMAEIGEAMGLKSLLDHGAVGSMTKVFEAGPFIKQYVDKLESSLDYLARLLFMLYWKPKDFADSFGTDDLPNLENKLTGWPKTAGCRPSRRPTICSVPAPTRRSARCWKRR